MNATDKEQLEKKDILESMEEEIKEIQNEEGQIDETKLQEALEGEIDNTADILAKTMADFENYKKRVERDKEDMIFYIKSDIIKTILPRIDDLERIIKNTPKDSQKTPLYEGLVSTLNKLLKDLDKLGIKPFNSIGEEVNPDLHEVITVIPGKADGKIIEEYEKGYMLNDKILRYAKVIVGGGE